MKKSNILIPAAIALIVIAGGIFMLKNNLAQPQVPAGSPQLGEPMGGPPSFRQFAEFQKSHKYTFQLMKLVGNIGRLEDKGKASLMPAQAKSAS